MAVVVNFDAPRRTVQIEDPGHPFQQLALRSAFRHAPTESFAGIVAGMFNGLAPPAAPRAGHADPASGFYRQGIGNQGLVGQGMAQQDSFRRLFVGIELAEKGFQHFRRFLFPGMGWKIGPVAEIATAADEKDLNAGLSAVLMGGYDVGGVDFLEINVLVHLDAGQGPDAVAELGRQFEFEAVAGRLHLAGQGFLDFLAFTGKKGPGLFD